MGITAGPLMAWQPIHLCKLQPFEKSRGGSSEHTFSLPLSKLVIQRRQQRLILDHSGMGRK